MKYLKDGTVRLPEIEEMLNHERTALLRKTHVLTGLPGKGEFREAVESLGGEWDASSLQRDGFDTSNLPLEGEVLIIARPWLDVTRKGEFDGSHRVSCTGSLRLRKERLLQAAQAIVVRLLARERWYCKRAYLAITPWPVNAETRQSNAALFDPKPRKSA